MGRSGQVQWSSGRTGVDHRLYVADGSRLSRPAAAASRTRQAAGLGRTTRPSGVAPATSLIWVARTRFWGWKTCLPGSSVGTVHSQHSKSSSVRLPWTSLKQANASSTGAGASVDHRSRATRPWGWAMSLPSWRPCGSTAHGKPAARERQICRYAELSLLPS